MEDAPKILIIDPNAKVSASLEKELTQLGFSASTACQPDGPLDELVHLRPELAVLGPTMDWLNSQKCFHKLKIVDPTMPIVVLTDDVEQSALPDRVPFECIYEVHRDAKAEQIGNR